ncbi:hypothetical protein GCM10022237_47270 [Nocardioides ginsengisoli]|uniref:Uncharacterized protein n=1 Tax=Nocardioides ginsengisoli TaxID=363868 RepID=A0ABW3W2E8_9ACTN
MRESHILDQGHLSHDRPCPHCGHAWHYYLPCDSGCGCDAAHPA